MVCICHTHKRAFRDYGRFTAHWNMQHPGEGGEKPAKEEVEVEEIPEGYEMVATKSRRKVAAEEPTDDFTDFTEDKKEVTKPRQPKQEIGEISSDLPQDFMGRVKVSLQVHGFPDEIRTRIVNVLKLHPEAHDNPANFSNLFMAVLGPSARQHQHKLNFIVSEVFGGLLGDQMSQPPYIGYQPQPQFGQYNPFSPAPGASPYYPQAPGFPPQPFPMYYPQMPTETKTDPELERRLGGIESSYNDVMTQMKAVADALAKQQEEKEKSVITEEIKQLRSEIAAGKSAGGGTDNELLKLLMSQRDEHNKFVIEQLGNTIKDMSGKLENAVKELSSASQSMDTRITSAINQREEVREKVRKEMEDVGYAPRKKDIEEKVVDILGKDVIPGAVSEIRETGKSIRESFKASLTGGSGGNVLPVPVTPEQADKVAQMMSSREKMRRVADVSQVVEP